MTKVIVVRPFKEFDRSRAIALYSQSSF